MLRRFDHAIVSRPTFRCGTIPTPGINQPIRVQPSPGGSTRALAASRRGQKPGAAAAMALPERRTPVMRILTLILLVTLATCLPPTTQPAHADDSRDGLRHRRQSIVINWNDAMLEAVRRTRLGPTIVARTLAVVHTCMYDAWAAYDERALGTEFGGALRRPHRERTRANKEAAVSFAAHRALADLFPTERALFDELLARLGYTPADAGTDPQAPPGIGTAACDAVLEARHRDGSNQLGDNGSAPYSDYTAYAPVNTPIVVVDPNRWQPITFTNGQTPGFLTPHWGRVVPFATTDLDALRPPPPALYPSAEYTTQSEALLRISANLTDRQKMISEYWSDGPASETPPGHWNLFAQQVSRRNRHSLDEDVKLFFLLGNTLLDVSIAVWDCKRFYDYVRPITAIRFLFAGQQVEAWAGPTLGTRTIDGGTWLPYQPETFLTPPFAEYVSGHSTFSAGSAEILKRFTGSDLFFSGVILQAGSSRIEPGLTPSHTLLLFWLTFSDAADEAGWSRRYGGIHFEDGDLEGRKLGRSVATRVWSKGMRLIEGR
jgi:hypothetical protein